MRKKMGCSLGFQDACSCEVLMLCGPWSGSVHEAWVFVLAGRHGPLSCPHSVRVHHESRRQV